MVRLGGRAMDGDNLAGAFKAVRDAVATFLGVDDADPRVKWSCRQRPGGQCRCALGVSAEEAGHNVTRPELWELLESIASRHPLGGNARVTHAELIEWLGVVAGAAPPTGARSGTPRRR